MELTDIDRLLVGEATGWVFWTLMALLVLEQVLARIPERLLKAGSTLELVVSFLKAVIRPVAGIITRRPGK